MARHAVRPSREPEPQSGPVDDAASSRIDHDPLANVSPPPAVQDTDADDARLVARVRGGDERAFEKLARAHYRASYVVALSVVGRQVDAEDVCHDAWVRALERIGELREAGRFRAWLLQIVRHTALNHLERARVRQAEPLDSAAAQRRGDPRQDLIVIFLRARLERALVGISAVQRDVVLLHDLDGWSHRAIAAQLGMSEVMSRQHLFQGRRLLRRLLGEKDADDGR